MENQHRKIAGYRELSQEEVELMNRIKAKGDELLCLQAELSRMLILQEKQKIKDATREMRSDEAESELDRFRQAEPLRWAAIGKTDIQTGIMAMVRAVAQPSI